MMDQPEGVANSVWQSHSDAALLAMTPTRFHESLGPGVDDEVAEEAWVVFRGRQAMLVEVRA